MANVLITGGSRGIGAATVKLFCERGHKVAFVYNKNDGAAAAVAKETGARPIKADVSDFDTCASVYAAAEMAVGKIDILVNCAGIAMLAQICDTTADMWHKVVDCNLTSAYAMSKAASEAMVREKRGTIINVGSVWGRVGASCESAYSASKAGLRALTTSLAKELSLSGIRVNCVEPGVIDTDMNACLGEEALEELKGEIPLARLGAPADVAELIYFLASDAASYITGQIIGIDGGFYL